MGRIQKRKTNFLQIIIFALQRAAGPYIWATTGLMRCSKKATYLFNDVVCCGKERLRDSQPKRLRRFSGRDVA
jgi:hypothetical protein